MSSSFAGAGSTGSWGLVDVDTISLPNMTVGDTAGITWNRFNYVLMLHITAVTPPAAHPNTLKFPKGWLDRLDKLVATGGCRAAKTWVKVDPAQATLHHPCAVVTWEIQETKGSRPVTLGN